MASPAEHAAPADAAAARLAVAADLEAVGTIVRTAARALARAQGATFVLRDGSSCFYADEDAMSLLWKGQRFPMEQCVTGWSMLHREIAVIPDIAQDPRVPMTAYRATFVRSLVAVPIPGVDGPVGAIGAYWDRVHTAEGDVVSGLRDLAGHAGQALDRIGLDDAPWAPNFAHPDADDRRQPTT